MTQKALLAAATLVTGAVLTAAQLGPAVFLEKPKPVTIVRCWEAVPRCVQMRPFQPLPDTWAGM